MPDQRQKEDAANIRRQRLRVLAQKHRLPPDPPVAVRATVARRKNPCIQVPKDILTSGDKQSYKNVFNNYDLRRNKVFKLALTGRKWLVPERCRWQIVKVGHIAFDKTIEKLKQNYWLDTLQKMHQLVPVLCVS